MKIREYTKDDFSKVKFLLEGVGLFQNRLDPKKHWGNRGETDPKIFLAEETGEIIGCVFIEGIWMANIFHLAVSQTRRREGIGTLLLNEAKNYLKGKGAEAVGIYIDPNNEELKEFYLKRGFEDFDIYRCLEAKL
jgi:ribosomal protein S18 acetylase RimI-like enzyme